MTERKFKVLITGGTRGLGRSMAEHLAGKNCEVYILGKTKRSEIDGAYLSILAGYYECDMSNLNELEACFGSMIGEVERIDILINNATVRQFKKLDEFQPFEIQNNINVDFLASVVLSHLCLPLMKLNNFGRIINISSISAFTFNITGTLYCSSKRALIAFSETLSKELADLKGAITVNAICPDAFSKTDGTILKNHRMVTNSVLSDIDRIIQSKSSGKVFNAFTFSHKLRESLRFVVQAVRMLVS